MHNRERNILGFSKHEICDERNVLKYLRKKLNDSPKDLRQLTEAALILMQMCSNGMVGMKLENTVFCDMIMTSESENWTVTMNMIGFEPISHSSMFAVLKKKYGKQDGALFEENHCEIPLNFIKLPNDRTGSPHQFPPIKIKVTSSIDGLKFEIMGESGLCL